MRQKHRLAGDSIELDRVQSREQIARDSSDGHRLPRTDDVVGEQHHPTGGEADGPGKDRRGVGNLAGGVGHGADEMPIDDPDGQQHEAADGKRQHGAHGAAAQQPVVHDDQPADADHGAEAEREEVGQPQLASERNHECARILAAAPNDEIGERQPFRYGSICLNWGVPEERSSS